MSKASEVNERVVPGVNEDQTAFDKEKNKGYTPTRGPKINEWMTAAISGQTEGPEDVVLAARVLAEMDASYTVDSRAAGRIDAEVRREEARKGEPLPQAQQDRLAEEEAARISEVQAFLREVEPGEDEFYEDEIEDLSGPGDMASGPEPDLGLGPTRELQSGMEEDPDGGPPVPGEVPNDEVPSEAPVVDGVAEPPVAPVSPVGSSGPEAEDVLARLPIFARRKQRQAARVPASALSSIRQALAAATAPPDARVFEEIGKLEAQIQDMTKVLEDLKATVHQSNANSREIKNLLQAEAVKSVVLPEADALARASGDDPSGDLDEDEPGGWARTDPAPRRWRLQVVPLVLAATASLLLLLLGFLGMLLVSRPRSAEAPEPPRSDRAMAARDAAHFRADYLRAERRELQAALQVGVEGARLLEAKRGVADTLRARPGATEAERAAADQGVRDAELDVVRWGREAERAKANLLRVKTKLPE